MAEKKTTGKCSVCGGKHSNIDRVEDCRIYALKHSPESIKRFGHPVGPQMDLDEFKEWCKQFGKGWGRVRP